ncbi:hypothetical protein [Streptomyces liangshanensis]|uniref:hypothetical protein n=1 Tax=Streptomyces liangshanensis TaxID=2717324 RepID=UPI001FB95104|nr:hypothetical protein [Streptomyces liangshanensis]
MRAVRRAVVAFLAAPLIPLGLTVLSEVREPPAPHPATARPGPHAPGAAAAPERDRERDREKGRDRDKTRDRDRATCRTRVEGSRATASCHNPYPVTDRVRLHVECARWWDVDADSAPVELHPAGYVQLSDRCWKEVRSVWVSHDPVR